VEDNPVLTQTLRRIWRGAWRRKYGFTEGWVLALEACWRLYEVLGALFILTGPIWIVFFASLQYSRNPKDTLIGASFYLGVWLLLTVLAYCAGRDDEQDER
jgi:hypothetical protein